MSKLHVLTLIAALALTSAAHAQNFTGGVAIGGDGSYSSTSLSFGATDLYESGDGTFAPLGFGLVTTANGSITGLSGTNTLTLSAPLPTFEISSSTTPANEYDFEITDVTPQSTAGVFTGDGLFVDTQNVLTTTPATYTLSFSGPASYSFSADVVQAAPEPASWALGLVAIALIGVLRRRVISA